MIGKIVPCGFCKATGKIESDFGLSSRTMCPVCAGRKMISVPRNAEKCRDCNGTGRQRCSFPIENIARHIQCRGTGWVARSVINTKIKR